jgi:hypothetical protein
MTRRRLILAACIALAALGAAWWWFANALSEEERQLVGSWRIAAPPRAANGIWEFDADRRWRTFDDPLLSATGSSPRDIGSVTVGHFSFRRSRMAFGVQSAESHHTSDCGVGPPEPFTIEFVTPDHLVLNWGGELLRFDRVR